MTENNIGALENPAQVLSSNSISVSAIPLTSVVIDRARKRAVNFDTVNRLCLAFQVQGLLQPIGVKPRSDDDHYRLVFGRHRLLARKKQAEESDPRQNTILAMIFPAEMPDWQCEAIEIMENLVREELSPAERDAHTALYLALLKNYGMVVDGDTARKVNASNQHEKGAHREGDGSDFRDPPPSLTVEGDGSDFRDPPPSLQTVTEKASRDLGITGRAIRDRIQKARELAEVVGVTTTNTTPETMTANELEAVGKAALDAAEKEKAAKKSKAKAPVKWRTKPKATATDARIHELEDEVRRLRFELQAIGGEPGEEPTNTRIVAAVNEFMADETLAPNWLAKLDNKRRKFARRRLSDLTDTVGVLLEMRTYAAGGSSSDDDLDLAADDRACAPTTTDDGLDIPAELQRGQPN